MRVVIDLDGDPHEVVRVLRHLLRRLLRDHNVRCRAIAPVADGER